MPWHQRPAHMQGWSGDRSANYICAPCLAVFASTYVIYGHSLPFIPPLHVPLVAVASD